MQSFVYIIAGSTHCLIKLCFEELKILHTKCNEWELEKSRESNTGGRDNPGGDRGLVRRWTFLLKISKEEEIYRCLRAVFRKYETNFVCKIYEKLF
jgi:hypothetical protein